MKKGNETPKRPKASKDKFVNRLENVKFVVRTAPSVSAGKRRVEHDRGKD